MSLRPGAQIDRYEVVSLIGAGGMGEVYLVRDTRLERNIALKLLPLRFTSDADRMRRFTQEAKAASALNHPNILTVHEIGESGQQPFIATEFVEGVTLRQSMSAGTLSLDTVLDIAIQIANALSAAHAAGIVHRDLKPENIVVRPDGVVKILDFGLAKLTAPASILDSEAQTIASDRTTPGVVFGTMRYMSPEQARGIEVDGRSDVFSLGVLLYEMLAGQPPFDGDTPSDVVASILKTDPAPVARFMPDAPEALLRAVEKALRKDREERYQSVKDLLIDLKDVKRDLEFEARLAQSAPSSEQDTASLPITPTPRESGPVRSETDTSASGLRHALRSLGGDYPFSARVMSRRRQIGLLAAAFALVFTAIALFSYFPRADALTDRDTILLADFVNSTGDPVFEGTLKQGLAVQLSQSPFLNIFPEARVRETLRLMGREPDEAVTSEIGREICQRQGLKAFVTGSITKFDRTYSITLQAIESQSGGSLGYSQIEADEKDRVLGALSQAATDLRQQLGESLATIDRFDAPLEVTTSSLEALHAYSLAVEQGNRGHYLESMPLFKRALELDPNFASAWSALAVYHYNLGQPELAAEFTAKALALKDRASELERLRIASFAHGFITRDIDETMKILELYKRTYPRDYRAAANLAAGYVLAGQFEKAIPEANDAIRANPDSVSAYVDGGLALLALGRLGEANELADRALQRNLSSSGLHALLYMTAFLRDDQVRMQQAVDWARGRPDEHVAIDWQARSAAAEGQWQRSRELTNRTIQLAAQTGATELAGRYAAEGVLRDATFGACPPAKSDAVDSLGAQPSRVTLTWLALAWSLCGDKDGTASLIEQLDTRYPKDTLIRALWLPTIRASLALERSDPAEAALQELAVIRFEPAGELWPAYIRGSALLKRGSGEAAAAEFRRIVSRRGQAPLSPLHALAQLGLARAIALDEDTSDARKAYEDFFASWKRADADVPILQAAKAEYARLGR